jgi:hypothetical protein
VWYLIREGRVRACFPAPVEEEAKQRVRIELEEVFRGPCVGGPPEVDEVDGVLLVAGWFRRHRQERSCCIEIETLLGRKPK